MQRKIELRLPLKHIFVTQPFGVNYFNFYSDLGMAGHNGIDFRAYRGYPCYAAHDGIANSIEDFYKGKTGLGVKIFNKENQYRTLQYHLLDVKIKNGQEVKAGELIGHCDNTGYFTTADHDHFDLKLTDEKGDTGDWDNGYKGAINPAPYFKFFYDGSPLNNKDWDKSRAYHRYGKQRNWLAEFYLRFAPAGIKNQWTEAGRYIHRRLKAIGYTNPALTGEQVNAIIYGSWDFEAVINPGLYETWGHITKAEYMKGERAFLTVVDK